MPQGTPSRRPNGIPSAYPPLRVHVPRPRPAHAHRDPARANRIVLFMKGDPRAPQCGFSAKAIGALDALGVDYAHVNVLADAGDPRRHQGVRRVADDPAAVHRRRTGRRQRHHRADGRLRRTARRCSAWPRRTAARRRSPSPPPPRQMLREAVANAGDGYALQVDVDARFNAKLQLAPSSRNAIAAEAEGLRVQFDLASARRARGLSIDWVDDERGRGLVIDNPNAPPKVQPITPIEAAERVAAGTLMLVDVRPGGGARAGVGQRAVRRARRRRDRAAGSAAEGHRAGFPVPPRPPQRAGRRAFPQPGLPRACTTSMAASRPGATPTRTCRATDRRDSRRPRRTGQTHRSPPLSRRSHRRPGTPARSACSRGRARRCGAGSGRSAR